MQISSCTIYQQTKIQNFIALTQYRIRNRLLFYIFDSVLNTHASANSK